MLISPNQILKEKMTLLLEGKNKSNFSREKLKYENQEDIYISFRYDRDYPDMKDVNKYYDGNTPLGVYAYHLKEIWDFPHLQFSERPYLLFLKGKGKGLFTYNLSDIDYDKNLSILQENYPNSNYDDLVNQAKSI